MSREILFRGKRKNNGEFVEGYLFTSWGRAYILWGTINGAPYMIEVDPATVGRYTGLTDKNDVEIFEGDVVRLVLDWHDGTNETWDAVVEFGNPNGTYSWGWQLKPTTECIFNPDILLWVGMEETGASCEVIGNVFDNPELLEGDGRE